MSSFFLSGGNERFSTSTQFPFWADDGEHAVCDEKRIGD
jgi:hypothetical protein